MSFGTRRLVALAGPMLLAAPAVAGSDLLGLGPDLLAKIANAPGDKGTGSGMMQMPRTDRLGRLFATLEGEQGKSRYILDADLTLFLPASPNEFPRQQVGGVYGTISKVLDDKGSTQPVGLVDGLWTMEQDLTGELDALVWHRNAADALEIGGLIETTFRVHDTAVREDGASFEIWIGGPPIQAGPREAGRDEIDSRGYHSTSPAISFEGAGAQQEVGGRTQLGEDVPSVPGGGSGFNAAARSAKNGASRLGRAGNVNVFGPVVGVGAQGPAFLFAAGPAGAQQGIGAQPAPARVNGSSLPTTGAGGMNPARRQRQKPPRSANSTGSAGLSFTATSAGPQQAATRSKHDPASWNPLIPQQSSSGGGGGSSISNRGASLGQVGANVGNAQVVLGGGGGAAPFGFRAVAIGGGNGVAHQGVPGTRSDFRSTAVSNGMRPADRQRIDPNSGEPIQHELVGPAVLRFKLID